MMWLFGKPKAAHLTAGQQAEDAALAYLQGQGLALVERNYCCRGGEIDLIMRDGAMLVFVEVRYRQSQTHGGALASVGARKQSRLIVAASHYLACKRIDRPTRFDVAAVSPDGGKLAIQWIKAAFQA
ncbi:MAG: YraN family protein [Candidatus Methylumidiphilus sp.]